MVVVDLVKVEEVGGGGEERVYGFGGGLGGG